MALRCIWGTKECCGCGECQDVGKNRAFCELCRDEIPKGENSFSVSFYQTLCLKCYEIFNGEKPEGA